MKFIDIFAGIGGFRLAFEAANFTCVFSSEWDVYAQKTYANHFGDLPEGDITRIPSNAIPDFEVLCAGFPCQPFSHIGRREGFAHPTQGTLFHEIVRILVDKRPIAFLLENVEGLVHHDHGRTFRIILDSLAISENGVPSFASSGETLRYHLFWDLLNARDYGLPQSRNRLYLVGFYEEKFANPPNFRFPTAFPYRVPVGSIIETDQRGYAISQHLQHTYLFKRDDGRPQIVDPNSREQAKTLVSTYHKIQRLTGTFVRDEGCETGLRLLTENECKRLMGFPPDFTFPVSRTQMYRQLGNSVAVPVVQAIATEMRRVLVDSRFTPCQTREKSRKVSQLHLN